MKIIVTGGAGFIGSHIVDEYIRQGGDVAVIDNLSAGKKENIHPDARFYKIDITSPEIEDVFRELNPNIVNHHAAQINVRHSISDPSFDAKVNITGTINLLENCIRFNTKKIIFASTGGAIYSEKGTFPAKEDNPTQPLSPYGISKLSAEYYLSYYKSNHGLDYVALRYSNVYGPRQDPYGEAGVIAIFIQKMLNGGQPIINGDGSQTRDFVYIDDVVKANILALKTKHRGVFNIGTAIETDINTIFNLLIKITGSKTRKIHGMPKSGEQKRSVISYKNAERILGWKPEVSLEQGLKRTVKYFQNRLPIR